MAAFFANSTGSYRSFNTSAINVRTFSIPTREEEEVDVLLGTLVVGVVVDVDDDDIRSMEEEEAHIV